MQHRPTTPAIIVAALLAIAVGVGVAWKVNAGHSATLTTLPAIEAPKAGPHTELSGFNPALLYEQRSAGVVTVDATFGNQAVGGTGFVADRHGNILTSSHVIVDYASDAAQADAVWVDFQAGDRVPAKVVGIDRFSDIAVLRVDPKAVKKLSPLPLGDSDKVIVGEPVAAIGSPFGNKGSLSVGIVSAAHRSIDAVINSYQIADAIQTDAAINHGNSGGPLFNARGEVIGINQQIRATGGQATGVGFAIPINTAKRTLRQILQDGAVRYAYMGVKTTTVTPQIARALELRQPTGVLVDSLAAAGPASAAGLREGTSSRLVSGKAVRAGDHIVSIAGTPVRSTEDVNRIVSRLEPGAAVAVVYFRDGEHRTASVKLAERPL